MPSKNWRVLVEQADKLAKQGAGMVYDRVRLLAKVFEDKDFLNDMQGEGTTPGDFLNKHVNDTCANFTELYQMLKRYPNRRQWEATGLADMRQALIASLKTQRVGGASGVTRNRVSREEFEKLQDENAQLRLEVKHLKSELGSARETIRMLRAALPKAPAKAKAKRR